MTSGRRTILVTSALPYANGSLHLGHMVEYLQTDIWVRFQKMRGHDCIYVCADDAHGTPVMLKARAKGISAEELIAGFLEEHRRDFTDFQVEFDNFYTTHSDENRLLVNRIYENLVAAGRIDRRTISQAYDEREQMFLPDRYVRGQCPHCGAKDQYGDNCENCGSTYSPADLIDPISVVSGTTPIEKDSEHFFFRLADFEDMLKDWIRSGHTHSSVTAKLEEWFVSGLRDWDISRDAPYFGFEIPDAPGKYFYVWLDAPVGYMASFLNLCNRRNDLDFDAYWSDPDHAELYHFIGKDIIYFHALFWPAVLTGSGFRTPTGVYAHGFLTVNGVKMSKARGTFITARSYLDRLDPDYLRYYYAAKLGPGVDDIDLNLDDFVQRVNSDLVGKLANIASRCARFILRNFDGQLADTLPEPVLYDEFVAQGEEIAMYYENRQFSRVVREIMTLADRANQYIDREKPWVLAKEQPDSEQVQAICTQGLNLFRTLMAYLRPVVPQMGEKAESFLNGGSLTWENSARAQTGTTINQFEPLITRIDPANVADMVEASRESLQADAVNSEP
ncbi:MAG: methionine--tRNA ligase [Gammaproteobacteria bacterium]